MDINELLDWVFESRCLNTLLTNPQIDVDNLVKESLPLNYPVNSFNYLLYKQKVANMQINFNQTIKIKEKLIHQKIIALNFKK